MMLGAAEQGGDGGACVRGHSGLGSNSEEKEP